MTVGTLCDCGSCDPTVVPTHLQAFAVVAKKKRYWYRIAAVLPPWCFTTSSLFGLSGGDPLALWATTAVAMVGVVMWDDLVDWMRAAFVLPPEAVYSVGLLTILAVGLAAEGGSAWSGVLLAASMPMWLRRGVRAATLAWVAMALGVTFVFYATMTVFDRFAAYLSFGRALLLFVIIVGTCVPLLVALVRSAVWNVRQREPWAPCTPVKLIGLFYAVAGGAAVAVGGTWSVLPLIG